MTEPCHRCPPFVVRCGHLPCGELGSVVLLMWDMKFGEPPYFKVSGPIGYGCPDRASTVCPTRAEADAEFDRREEALLA